MKEPASGTSLEIGPELVGALYERHVARVLVVRLADDPGQSMRRAEGMGRREAIESDDAHAALCKVKERGASHRPEAENDDVGSVTHGEGHCAIRHDQSIPASAAT